MRFIVLCCILLFLSDIQAQSRFSYGIGSGCMISNRIIAGYKSALYKDYRNSKETGLPGISAEASVRYRISSKIDFETGLGYLQNGYAVREERLIDPGFSPVTSGYYSELYRYVNKNVFVPLNMSYSTKGRIHFMVTAGPVIFFPVSEHVEWILRKEMGRSGEQAVDTRKNESDSKNVALDFNLGLGVGYRLNEKLNILLQPKVVYDLLGSENTDIRDHLYYISMFEGEDRTTREHLISFGLTLMVQYHH
jgi:hypothetical protein